MITPNKAISLKESALGHLGVILKVRVEGMDLITLYHKVADQFESLDQFLLTLDTLYILGRIDVNVTTRVVNYAP
ncbi:ABC-three component system middle component 7 [Granulicella sibirica]|uniref:ABC-three component system middle component 7 n=1 Tax=Granulicella sibirica TaxID=2479048 RepID=UPI002690AA37